MSISISNGVYIKKSSNSNLGSGASLFTRGIWLKMVGSTLITGDDLSNQNTLFRWRGVTGNKASARLWTVSGSQNISGASVLSADTWYFVVLTHDTSAGQVLYVNGAIDGTGSTLENIATVGTLTDYLGDQVSNWEVGDELRFGGEFTIEGKALSLAEVQALYANRSGGGGTAKPTDHADVGISIQCTAFDQTSGTVTNGDSGLADLGDTSNPWVTNTGSPTWVDDDPGHNWSSEPSTYEYNPTVPTSFVPREMARALHGGDCRVITLGDSFSNWPLTGRLLPMGWLLADPKVRLTAFCTGDPLTAANGLLRAYNACTGTTFDVTSADYEVENGSGTYFALPVHDIRGIYCDGSLSLNGGTRFVQYRWRDALLATDGVRSQIASWSYAKSRALFLAAAAGANQLPDLQLKDVNAATTVDCDFTTDGCRKRYMDGADPEADGGRAVVDGAINACYPDIALVKTSSEFHLDILKGDTDPVSDNTFLQLAGAVCYQTDPSGNRVPGLYYSTLDGNSWSYVGFSADTAATGAGQKTFADAQVRPWLDVTTLDPDQQVIIIQNLADELNNQATHKTKMEALITRWDARCSGITTNPPKYLFIVQFAHEITGDPDEERQNQLDRAAAAYEVATDPTYSGRAGYVSLFQKMDGNYATTDAASGVTGGEAAWAAWATARGWDAFTNSGTIDATDLTGGLLDPNLHLNGSAEATAVGTLLAEALSKAEASVMNTGLSTAVRVGI